MSERNDDRPPNGVAEGLSDSGLAEPVLVKERGGWRRVWRLTRLGLVSLLVLALVAAAILWIERKPIANNVLASELAKRGVQATYTLDRVGLRTQQVSN